MEKFLVLSVAITILFGASFAYPQIDGRIAGGSTAEEEAHPYTVSIRQVSSNKHICGGSILNENWLLSAARCVYGENATNINVRVGTNQLITGGINYRIESLVVNDNFNPADLSNDIALLKVSTPLLITTSIQPISINPAVVEPGTSCLVTGWGSVTEEGPLSNALQELALTTISNEDCSLQINGTITDTLMCTFTRFGEGICTGDAGAPLVADGMQIGVASWGQICGMGYPDVFTRVSPYVDWINSIIS